VPSPDAADGPTIQELVTRLDALEEEVSALREQVSGLRRDRTDLEIADAD
jgi:prefoldin subunit 5